MARQLEVGPGLQLPLQWMTGSSVVYGTRGSGKSTLGRKLAEEVALQGQRFCAIDPTGAWWGLKSSESGADVGLPVVIFGGDHADVPLEPGAGDQLADIVVEIDQSVILDLELLSKGKQIVFIGAFLERLYHINREPLLLLMDEAQRYAPQKPMSVEASKTLGATEDIVKLGRKHGLGAVVFTQRGSGLNKEVSELGDVLIAFRTPGVLDQGRIKDWLEANATAEQLKAVMASISGLPTGTAIFASNHPDLRLFGTYSIDRPKTFDSSATPQVGQKRREPRILSKPDLEALNAKMATAIERAKADDPKELKKRIAELEKDDPKWDGTEAAHPAWWRGSDYGYKKGLADAKPETVEKIVEKSVLDEMDHALVDDLITALESVATQVGPIKDLLVSRLAEIRKPDDRAELRAELKNKTAAELGRLFEATVERGPIDKDSFGEKSKTYFVPYPEMKLGKAERQILGVLQLHGPRTRSQLALQTGYSPRTSTLSVALGRLRKLDLVTTSNPIELTDLGKSVDVGEIEVLPPPGPELASYWISKLGKAEREILRVMVEAHPNQLDRGAVAQATGYSTQTSTLSVALGRLRKLELVSGWEVSSDLIG